MEGNFVIPESESGIRECRFRLRKRGRQLRACGIRFREGGLRIRECEVRHAESRGRIRGILPVSGKNKKPLGRGLFQVDAV